VAGETILGSEETNETEGETLATEVEENTATSDEADAKLESSADKDDTLATEGEAEKDKDSSADESEGAPEKYKDFVVPDDMEIDANAMGKASTLFKELNLSQAQAQKLVDFEVGVKAAEAEKAVEAWETTMADWKQKSTNDSEFGGSALKSNLVHAKAAQKAFGNDEFKEMLEITGVGNHPEMLRFLISVGKNVSEDSILQGSTSSGSADPAKIMFPSMN
jgi:hypothetical protein